MPFENASPPWIRRRLTRGSLCYSPRRRPPGLLRARTPHFPPFSECRKRKSSQGAKIQNSTIATAVRQHTGSTNKRNEHERKEVKKGNCFWVCKRANRFPQDGCRTGRIELERYRSITKRWCGCCPRSASTSVFLSTRSWPSANLLLPTITKR